MKTGFMSAPRKGLRSSLSRVTVGAFVIAAAVAPSAVAAGDAPSGPTTAAVINPCLYAGYTADDLRAAFPALSQRELDYLLFRVADMASLQKLASAK